MTKPLLWVPGTDTNVLEKMLGHKLDPAFQRPSRLDVEAQQAIIISKRSTCMFYEVGARIFYVHDGNHYFVSDGYNGAAKGDVDPRLAGCARVVNGKLEEGKGLCRGSHAELNATNNCRVDTRIYSDVRMMVTLHPCYPCAKQIANAGIKHLYYIWDYKRDDFVLKYLEERKIIVEQYSSPMLDGWIKRNNYDPEHLRYHHHGDILHHPV